MKIKKKMMAMKITATFNLEPQICHLRGKKNGPANITKPTMCAKNFLGITHYCFPDGAKSGPMNTTCHTIGTARRKNLSGKITTAFEPESEICHPAGKKNGAANITKLTICTRSHFGSIHYCLADGAKSGPMSTTGHTIGIAKRKSLFGKCLTRLTSHGQNIHYCLVSGTKSGPMSTTYHTIGMTRRKRAHLCSGCAAAIEPTQMSMCEVYAAGNSNELQIRRVLFEMNFDAVDEIIDVVLTPHKIPTVVATPVYSKLNWIESFYSVLHI